MSESRCNIKIFITSTDTQKITKKGKHLRPSSIKNQLCRNYIVLILLKYILYTCTTICMPKLYTLYALTDSHTTKKYLVTSGMYFTSKDKHI